MYRMDHIQKIAKIVFLSYFLGTQYITYPPGVMSRSCRHASLHTIQSHLCFKVPCNCFYQSFDFYLVICNPLNHLISKQMMNFARKKKSGVVKISTSTKTVKSLLPKLLPCLYHRSDLRHIK